eukprot:jgi/Phyca11/125731/e_gw1.59.257.1
MKLQEDHLTLLDVRDIFDTLVVKHPVGIKHLTANASIVNGARSSQNAGTTPLGFAVQVLEARKKQRAARKKNRGVGYTPPTSNNVERLFSIVKHTLSLHRHSMLPIHLETAVFESE